MPLQRLRIICKKRQVHFYIAMLVAMLNRYNFDHEQDRDKYEQPLSDVYSTQEKWQ